jgi:hypothetical protein
MDEKETTSGAEDPITEAREAEDPITKAREAEVLITKARSLLLEVLQKSDVELLKGKPGGGGTGSGPIQYGCGNGCSCPKQR